jgi:hypothetical protein
MVTLPGMTMEESKLIIIALSVVNQSGGGSQNNTLLMRLVKMTGYDPKPFDVVVAQLRVAKELGVNISVL